MRRLGELLLERGAIALAELHTALEACHRSGGRLGTHLLRFGFVEERALLEALTEQYGRPFVPESMLMRASPTALRSVPADVLRRLQVVPLDRVGNRLQVAMLNPRDPAAVEELASVSGLVIEPYGATESAVLRALAELGEEEVVPAPGPTPPPVVSDAWWDGLWTLPRVGPRQLLGRRDERRHPVRVWLATFPELTPVVGLSTGEHELLDESAFVERLKNVRHRDEVGELLLRFASRYLSRLCLFAVHRGKAVGWMARGQAVVVDDVQSAEIPLDSPSLLRDVADSGQPFVGPLPPGNDVLARILAEPPAGEVVVIPVRVKERNVALLVGDNPGELALAVPLAELQIIANRGGVAFEILILRGKIEA